MEQEICTKETPFDKNNPEHEKFRWQHPDAKEVDSDYGGTTSGDFEKYECPNCKHRFWVELPN